MDGNSIPLTFNIPHHTSFPNLNITCDPHHEASVLFPLGCIERAKFGSLA